MGTVAHPGAKVRLRVIRDGKPRVISATLAELVTDPVVSAGEIHPGLAGAEFSTYDQKTQTYTGTGVIVDSVAPNSPAQFTGLEPNDVIAVVNQRPVENVADLRKVAENQSLLVLKIYRGNRVLLRTVR